MHLYTTASPRLAIIKVKSGVIRRSACHMDGEAIPTEQLATLLYLELFYGRSDFTADWTAEYFDRCSAEYHLHTKNDGWSKDTWRMDAAAYYDSSPEFYTILQRLCRKHSHIIMANKPVTRTFLSLEPNGWPLAPLVAHPRPLL